MTYEYQFIHQWETETDDDFLVRVNLLAKDGWRLIYETYYDGNVGRILLEKTYDKNNTKT